MLDTYRIKTRIAEIDKRVQILNRKFKPLSEAALVRDESLNAAAERHLEVALQATIDIGNHLISALGFERPSKELSEIFRTLAHEDIIAEDLSNKLADSTGYRNILVHDYLEVEKHITYKNIQERLSDLTEFARQVELFLEKFENEKGGK